MSRDHRSVEVFSGWLLASRSATRFQIGRVESRAQSVAPFAQLSIEQAALTYRGVDCEFVPPDRLASCGLQVELGLVSAAAQEEDVLRCQRLLGHRDLIDLVWCAFQSEPIREADGRPPGWPFLGFDFALWGSGEWAYSVLFHEVLFGTYPELVGMANSLNEHLLLSSREGIEALMARRSRLVAQGADLEEGAEDEGPFIVAVFGKTIGASSGA